ncbi:hypothetical protein CHUAL_009004 [Chamberlinius hualienensis]
MELDVNMGNNVERNFDEHDEDNKNVEILNVDEDNSEIEAVDCVPEKSTVIDTLNGIAVKNEVLHDEILQKENYKHLIKPLNICLKRLKTENSRNFNTKTTKNRSKLPDCSVVLTDLRSFREFGCKTLPFHPRNIHNILIELDNDYQNADEDDKPSKNNGVKIEPIDRLSAWNVNYLERKRPLTDVNNVPKKKKCRYSLSGDRLLSCSKPVKMKMNKSTKEEEDKNCFKCNISSNLSRLKLKQQSELLDVRNDVIMDKIPFIHLTKISSFIKRKKIYAKRIKKEKIDEQTNSNVLGSWLPGAPFHKKGKRNDNDDQTIDKEKKKVKKRKKINDGVGKPRKKFVRCGKCEGCLRPDCKICIYCLDMSRYGGKGVLKQACKLRKCLDPIVPDFVGNVVVAPLMMSADDLSSRKTSTTYKRILSKYFGVTASISNRARNRKFRRSNKCKSEEEREGGKDEKVGFRAYLASLKFIKEDNVKKSVIARRIFMKSKIVKKSAAGEDEDEEEEMDEEMNEELNEDETEIKVKSFSKIWRLKSGFIRPYQTKLDDLNEDLIWNEGKEIIIDGNNKLLNGICYLCGCSGLNEMIYCAVCCEPFHSFCLEEDEIPNEFNKHRWRCRRCQLCSICQQPNNLMKCCKCLERFHSMCLGQNYPLIQSQDQLILNQKWCCLSCARCEKCGSNVNIGIAKDQSSSLTCILCVQCLKVFVDEKTCIKCNKYVVKDGGSQVVMCLKCKQYLHLECDDFSSDDLRMTMNADEKLNYECKDCCSSSKWRENLLQRFNQQLTTIFNTFNKHIQPNYQLIDHQNLESDVLKVDNDEISSLEVNLTTQNESQRCLTPQLNLNYDFDKVKSKLELKVYSRVMDFVKDLVDVIGNNKNLKSTKVSDILIHLIKIIENVLNWFNCEFLKGYLKINCWSSDEKSHHLISNLLVNYVFKSTNDEKDQSETEIGRVCVICKTAEDDYYKFGGRLLFCGKNDWVHVNCAVWSHDVTEDDCGRLKGIYEAVNKANLMNCNFCGKLGASVFCCWENCHHRLHFVCALKAKYRFENDGKMYCSNHSSSSSEEVEVKVKAEEEVKKETIDDRRLFNLRRLSVL